MKTASLFSRLAIISLFLCLFNTSNVFAQPVDSLSVRVNLVLNKVDDIRLAFLKIAVMVRNEGAPGWEKIVQHCEEAGQTLDNLRVKINTALDRFKHNTLPLPSGIHIPGYTVHILNRDIHFPGLNANIPNFPPELPKVTTFISRFFDLLDQPLDRILQRVYALDDTLSNKLAIVKANVKFGFNPDDDFEEANYNYGPILRTWLADPYVLIEFNEVSAVCDDIGDTFLDALCNQDIAIAGEGGNLSIIKATAVVVKLPVDIMKELSNLIDGDVASAETNANYRRLGFIHLQIDSLQTQFRSLQTLRTKTKIEENLIANLDHPQPVAEFQLPSRLGGQLEKVKEIVNDVIQRMALAGENTYQANDFYQLGNQKYAAGKYKQAYYYYSKAYGEATFVELN